MTPTIEELEAALDYNNTKIGDLSSAFWPSHEYELRVNHYRTMNKALTQALEIAKGESPDTGDRTMTHFVRHTPLVKLKAMSLDELEILHGAVCDERNNSIKALHWLDGLIKMKKEGTI